MHIGLSLILIGVLSVLYVFISIHKHDDGSEDPLTLIMNLPFDKIFKLRAMMLGGAGMFILGLLMARQGL